MRYEFHMKDGKVSLRLASGTVTEVAEMIVRHGDRVLIRTTEGPEVLCEACGYVCCDACGDCVCDKEAKEKGEKPKGSACGCDERMAKREKG